MSLLDALVDAQAVAAGWPRPEREYRFHDKRKWRADYYWPKWARVCEQLTRNAQDRVALEIEGAVWTNGRHTRGSGFVKDMEKYNTMSAMGIRLIRLTPAQVRAGELETWLRKIAA